MKHLTLFSRILVLALGLFWTEFGLAQTPPAQIGKGSYYADKFEGRRCASGDAFSQDSLTAAHKNLPFGTRVRVTNLRTKQSVVVRINDRLPKHSKRTIDLTKRAARDIGMIKHGIAKVSIEVLPES